MASNSEKRKIIDKAQLRTLMKQQQSKLKQENKKIESPLAKYNNLGQLYCILCSVQVKSDRLWPAHINSRTHKDNVEALKIKGKPETVAVETKTPVTKRRLEEIVHEEEEKETKKLKSGQPLTGNFCDKKSTSGALVTTYSSDEEEQAPDAPAAESALPADFFDGSQHSSTKNDTTIVIPAVASRTTESSTKVPEGFFDNPEQDAKARKVEYRDPKEVEWEEFQKQIKQQSTVSEAIVEEEDAEVNVLRQLEEIDEQISNWSKVQALEKKMDKVKEVLSAKTTRELESMDSDSGDEEDLQNLLDWKAKGV